MNRMENKDRGILVIEDKEKIKNFIQEKSTVMYDFMDKNMDSDYVLIHKFLRHSDLTNRGKRNGPRETIEQNYLYYLSNSEMNEMSTNGVKFEDAKQSNISMPTTFYKIFGINYGEVCTLSDYSEIYLVNESLKYFDIDYTRKVFQKLGKEVKWKFEDLKLELEGDFTKIQLSTAAHGIGTSKDEIFHKLRCSMFRTDILMLLIKIDKDEKITMFIMLEKNPKFYSIVGEANEHWENYLNSQLKSERTKLVQQDNAREEYEEEKNRKQQNKWRNMLAEEMMNYTTTDGKVFCPFTYIEANFNAIGTLFRASHIKAFNKSNIKESYDLNNGLLLCANADALFDKHYISVDENKELVFSFLIKNDEILKQKLLLNQPIFKLILNEQRMQYMKHHYEKFQEAELKRKCNKSDEEDLLYVEEENEEYKYE